MDAFQQQQDIESLHLISQLDPPFNQQGKGVNFFQQEDSFEDKSMALKKDYYSIEYNKSKTSIDDEEETLNKSLRLQWMKIQFFQEFLEFKRGGRNSKKDNKQEGQKEYQTIGDYEQDEQNPKYLEEKKKAKLREKDLEKKLLAGMTIENYKAGQVVYKEDYKISEFYVIWKGEVEEIFSKAKIQKINRMIEGEYFGEKEIIFKGSRAAKVTCIQDSILIKIQTEIFQAMIIPYLRAIQPFYSVLSSSVPQSILSCFLSRRDMLEISYIQELETYKYGSYIYKEGDASDSFFFLTKGCISFQKIIKRKPDESSMKLKKTRALLSLLNTNECFGEEQMLDTKELNQEGIRNMTAQVVSNIAVLFKIPYSCFLERVQKRYSMKELENSWKEFLNNKISWQTERYNQFVEQIDYHSPTKQDYSQNNNIYIQESRSTSKEKERSPNEFTKMPQVVQQPKVGSLNRYQEEKRISINLLKKQSREKNIASKKSPEFINYLEQDNINVSPPPLLPQATIPSQQKESDNIFQDGRIFYSGMKNCIQQMKDQNQKETAPNFLRIQVSRERKCSTSQCSKRTNASPQKNFLNLIGKTQNNFLDHTSLYEKIEDKVIHQNHHIFSDPQVNQGISNEFESMENKITEKKMISTSEFLYNPKNRSYKKSTNLQKIKFEDDSLYKRKNLDNTYSRLQVKLDVSQISENPEDQERLSRKIDERKRKMKDPHWIRQMPKTPAPDSEIYLKKSQQIAMQILNSYFKDISQNSGFPNNARCQQPSHSHSHSQSQQTQQTQSQSQSLQLQNNSLLGDNTSKSRTLVHVSHGFGNKSKNSFLSLYRSPVKSSFTYRSKSSRPIKTEPNFSSPFSQFSNHSPIKQQKQMKS